MFKIVCFYLFCCLAMFGLCDAHRIMQPMGNQDYFAKIISMLRLNCATTTLHF